MKSERHAIDFSLLTLFPKVKGLSESLKIISCNIIIVKFSGMVKSVMGNKFYTVKEIAKPAKALATTDNSGKKYKRCHGSWLRTSEKASGASGRDFNLEEINRKNNPKTL